jgi:Cdc6-like AAA superfamily ATPase
MSSSAADCHFRETKQWLSTTDYDVQQLDMLKRCQEGTGQWFLQSPEFLAWTAGTAKSRTLFCPGIPGAGKTLLAATVVHALRKRFPSDETAVACLYCNYRMHDEQSARNLVAGLARQLLKPGHAALQHVQMLIDECQRSPRLPTLDELSSVLRHAAAAYSSVFIVVDALDECERTEWPPLLSQLRLLQAQMPHVRLLATSRPLLVFQESFSDAVKLEIRAHSMDLEHYIHSRVHRLSKHVEQTANLKTEVVRKVTDAADGM